MNSTVSGRDGGCGGKNKEVNSSLSNISICHITNVFSIFLL